MKRLVPVDRDVYFPYFMLSCLLSWNSGMGWMGGFLEFASFGRLEGFLV